MASSFSTQASFLSMVRITPGFIQVHNWTFLSSVAPHAVQVEMPLLNNYELFMVVALVIDTPITKACFHQQVTQ